MALRTKISCKYAGVKVAEHNQEDLAFDIAKLGVGNATPVEIENELYFISHGYYVPCYL